MVLDTPISTIMTRDVFILGAGDPLREAASTFNDHNIRHAPVVSQGKLVGMLSWIDLKRVPAAEVLDKLGSGYDDRFDGRQIVADAMSRDPVSVQANDPIRELAHVFAEHEFHAVPVMEGNRIVGIATTTDLIQFFLDNSEM